MSRWPSPTTSHPSVPDLGQRFGRTRPWSPSGRLSGVLKRLYLGANLVEMSTFSKVRERFVRVLWAGEGLLVDARKRLVDGPTFLVALAGKAGLERSRQRLGVDEKEAERAGLRVALPWSLHLEVEVVGPALAQGGGVPFPPGGGTAEHTT
ncbi:MAG: hypothetical protein CSB49_07535, partial [Proteobacteria bacterium]